MQFCGFGVSVAHQYYHAKKRSDESPLDYLYRLYVIGLGAKIKIKDGPPKVHKEHVEHYIETLDDLELADQLTIFRRVDVNKLEDVLRFRQRTKAWRGKLLFRSIKLSQEAPVPPDRPREVNRRSAYAVRTTLEEPSSEDLSSDDSGGQSDLRQIYFIGMEGQRESGAKTRRVRPTREDEYHRYQEGDQRALPSPAAQYQKCAHCRSRKHDMKFGLLETTQV
uniref:Uncharacterized protein n=1 Tax=Peronospora matthiolae TaxID=2874970 RepID=A0AAV1TSR7_9STRA